MLCNSNIHCTELPGMQKRGLLGGGGGGVHVDIFADCIIITWKVLCNSRVEMMGNDFNNLCLITTILPLCVSTMK